MSNDSATRYQNKIAGRVREDEDKLNMMNGVVMPTGIFSTKPTSGKAEPVLVEDHLRHTDVGKPVRDGGGDRDISAYAQTGTQSAKI
jgi:hypothetical protein